MKSGLIVMNNSYVLDEQNLNKIKNSLARVENIFLFLDYDGTLAPFKVDPLSAFALPEAESSLKKLEKSQKYHLSLVSGRKLSELKKMIDLNRCHYAGSHGLEIEMSFTKGVIYPHQKQELDVLSRKNYQKSREKYSKLDGVRVEDKGFGLALHFESENEQSAEEKKLQALFENTAYQVLSGRKLIEIRPVGWDKGKAINYISDQIRKNLEIDNILRIYIGDDRTDEDAFEVIKDGITIYVQNEDDLNTEAEYYLKNPEDTAELLKVIAGEL
ncbi:trehalose 6-phosphate phosphatase [Halanaerobium saccharolyticum]|uniref:Trehalose 6-phosphate phosphatase n=2 Tax=Halanaerobium saccharolyticum TaxID=43595 RepID=A0A4R7YUB2_9FIRM|nr:trehalose 6-phosphate phosphatase [Halanaerobium saccharolyticum]TDW00636.1 trehalose 6-phosphate phosphatase [Halanaerobium saccharolyticum]TDX52249.1 trehalose 6-phosphate phosphatase [Halanaerobium saccharolyticum]